MPSLVNISIFLLPFIAKVRSYSSFTNSFSLLSHALQLLFKTMKSITVNFKLFY